MIYVVSIGKVFEYFRTYREAEIFCGENGIHPENIYEEDVEEEG
jgi:hypothetical protein